MGSGDTAFAINNQQLSGVTTGTGTAIDTRGSPWITITGIWSAGVTAGVLTLESSPDGTNFASLGTLSFSAGATNRLAVTEAAKFVRARISTNVAGGTVSAYITIASPVVGDSGWSS